MKKNEKTQKTRFFILTVFLFCVGFILFSSLPALALQPPRPGEIEQLKAEGKFQKRLEKALKLGNHKVAPHLIEKAKRKYKKDKTEANELSEASSFTSASLLPYSPGLQSTGSPKTFALLIAFSDEPYTNSQAEMHEKLYGSGRPEDYPMESLANFYDRSSHGLLNLRNGSTLGWYTTSYPRDAVLEGYSEDEDYLAREALIKEALNHYESLGHDFSQYDNDGDGVMDYFLVFYTGSTTGWMSFWWGYKTYWDDETYLLDGKQLDVYSWQNEPFIDMQTAIHETGHALGLYDLYDYDGPDGSGVNEGGVGSFDIMDNNGDHNCLSKWLLGWVEPTVVSGDFQSQTLNAAETHSECLMIWPGVGLEDIFSEYFLVENRQSIGNDSNLEFFDPDGLAVWHIDATLRDDHPDFVNNNTEANPKLVKIMEADGLEEIESPASFCVNPPENWATDPWGTCSLEPSTECAGDGHCHVIYNQDLYNEGDAFTPETFPSSNKYDGSESCVRIWGIDDLGDSPGAAISANFTINCDCPPSPGTATLIMPADGAEDVSQTPTLNWGYVSNFYDVEICHNSTCTAVAATAKPTANYWTVYEELNSNWQYWWRVRTNNICGLGDWSPVWSFTTGCDGQVLSAPELLEPVNGQAELGVSPQVRWSEVPGATSYQVAVYNDPNPDSIVRTATISTENGPFSCEALDSNCWEIFPALGEGTYGFRVLAQDSCYVSEWSNFNTFTTLSKPLLTYPYYNATGISAIPSFEWAPVAGAADYQIEVCSNEDCTSVERTGTASAPETEWYIGPPGLDEQTLYYWRVQARNSALTNNNGPWSQVRGFTTCESPDTDVLQNASPSQGEMNVTIPVELSWDSVSGTNISFDVFVYSFCAVDPYEGQVCNDIDLITSGTDINTQWIIDQPLESGTYYWWQVRVNHACGYNDFPIQKFRTSDCPWVTDKRPYPEYPLDGEEVSTTPTLEWGYPFGQIFGPKEVEVCSDMECGTVVASVTVSGDMWTVDAPLAAQTQYWWRVRFVNECGAPWSYIYTFMTEGAVDSDGDGIVDELDNCDTIANPDQEDMDNDGLGDNCDPDMDGDGRRNESDNCPETPNGFNLGTCTSGTVGELCGVPDASCVSHCDKTKSTCLLGCFGDMFCQDQCLDDYDVCLADCPTLDCGLRGFCSQAQEDEDSDGMGDVCDTCPDGDDTDGDGLCDTADNCPEIPNGPALGTCTDGNTGASCREENITVCQSSCDKTLQSCQMSCLPGDIPCLETCVTDHGICSYGCDDGCGQRGFCSQAQEDEDANGLGDACDICSDTDSDGVCDDDDNCPDVPNGPDNGTCLEGDVGTACNMSIYTECEIACGGVLSGCLSRCLPGDIACQDRCQSDYIQCLNEGCDYGCGVGADCSLSQEDRDGDGIGDACESCSDQDADGICNGEDNCPSVPNGPARGTCTSENIGEECGNALLTDCMDACEIPMISCMENCPLLDTKCQSVCQTNYFKCTDSCEDVCGRNGFCSQSQEDGDSDGAGDACDTCSDQDGDRICDSNDNCVYMFNPDQQDSDGDGIGDNCDKCSDIDADGICDNNDNCPNIGNTAQDDADSDNTGDICDSCPQDQENDADRDQVCGDIDNCPYLSNPDQNDSDGDGVGDACEVCNDIDADGVCDNNDNCPNIPNVAQQDSDADGIGDLCDETPGCGGCGQPDCEQPGDADTDGIPDPVDNCLFRCNAQQLDADGDGMGDVCDTDPGCGGCGQSNCENEC